jgi:hypothetical protein
MTVNTKYLNLLTKYRLLSLILVISSVAELIELFMLSSGELFSGINSIASAFSVLFYLLPYFVTIIIAILIFYYQGKTKKGYNILLLIVAVIILVFGLLYSFGTFDGPGPSPIPSIIIFIATLFVLIQKTNDEANKLNTIIFIVLVLVVILLNVWAITRPVGGPGVQGCVAGPGFYCQTPSYSHATGAITLTIGQSTGTSWTSANIVFVPEGTPLIQGVPKLIFAANAITNGNFLYEGYGGNGITISGQTMQIVLPVNGISTNSLTCGGNCPSKGSTISGTIWVQYTLSGTTGLQYAQMAAFGLLKAS